MKRWISLSVASFLGLLLVAGFGFFATGWFSAGETTSRIFKLHNTPRKLPVISFQNGDGQSQTLTDLKGKVVLLNIWATWCGPCRREMPTLDRLQGELGGPGFEVLALSIDRGGPKVVRKFFNEISIRNLALYIDPSAKAGHALKVVGLPVTLLLDREGQEVGRLVGPAEWDTPEMISFFRNIIAKSNKSRTSRSHQKLRRVAGGASVRAERFLPTAVIEEYKR